MFVTQQLNELAKLALIASDASYFSTQFPVGVGTQLAPLRDTPSYDILPTYIASPGSFSKVREFSLDTVGFKYAIYQDTSTNEIIVAFGGTDGPDPIDWTGNTALGWNQWNEGRGQLFLHLQQLVNADTKVNFTGQSLGGALAQYAAYEWVQKKLTTTNQEDPEFLADFNKQNVSLTTFNGLGGLKALQDHTVYNPTVLQGIGLSGHFYVTNDLVSRLGGGHVGGDTFLLDFKSGNINPLTGQPYAYGLIDAHRIETGLYANLRPGALLEFQVASPHSVDYLNVDSVQEVSALFGNLLNNQNLGLVESRFRLVAAITAGLTIGSPSSVTTLTQALITSLHDSGDLSESWYQKLQGTDWGLIFIPARPVTGAISILSTLGAVFTDAVQGAASGISTIFQAIGEYVGAGSRPDVTVTPPASTDVSSLQRQLQFEILMASLGAAPQLTELTASIPSGLDPEALAAEMLSGGSRDWLPNTLAFARAQANTAGQSAGQLAEMTTQLVAAINHRVDALQDATLEEKGQLVAQLHSFTTDTAQGFARAIPDFLADVAGSFNLGRTLDFLNVSVVTEAYAAELDDRRLAAPIRTALEQAQALVQQAGQTVVVQSGIGANPFDTVGFDPATAPLATGTVQEERVNTFTAYLPYQAGTGGQSIQLTLNGLGTSTVTLLSGGQELTPINGIVTLVIPEGQRDVQFALRAQDLAADATVALVAQLVDGTGTATHQEHQEATITAVNTPAIDYANGLTSQVYTGTEGDDVRDLLGSFNYAAHGNGGNDLIFSRAGHDQLYGDAGHDSLYGFVGHDQLFGGIGRDLLIADFRDDYVPPSGAVAGQDVVDGGAEDDVVAGGGGDDHLIGGTGNDHLWGDNLVEGDGAQPGDPGSGLRGTYFFRVANTPGEDELDGGEGDDLLLGNLGDDVLFGGGGADKLFGDQVPSDSGAPVSFLETSGGADFLDGGDGNDLLQGDGGDDVLWGGAGHDQLYGDDRIAGAVTPGDDWLEGGAGDDLLVGGAGGDLLDGGADNDQLFGEEGDDVLDGGDGLDQLSGGIGDDDLYGGAGDDILAGHDGMDTLLGEAGSDQLDGGNDNDQVFGGTGNDVLFGQAGDDYLDGEENDDELQGGNGNDELVGDIGNDLLYGDAGVDTLWGDEGADQLTGGTGNDVLDGGSGSDTYVFNLGDGQDVLVDEATTGAGNQIQFGAGIMLSSLTFVQDEADETLTIQVGSTADTIQLQGFSLTHWSPVVDTLAFSNGTSAFLTELLPAPSGPIEGTSAGNSIRTGSGDDVIAAGGGDDAVTAGAGNDQVLGGSGNDTLVGGAGQDWLNGGSGDDVLLGGTVIGQTFEYDGDDTLAGGTGTDTLGGGTGRDTYLFNRGDGTDTIIDFAGEGNRLMFGVGITADALTFEANAFGGLIILTGTPGDAIVFGLGGFGVNQPPSVDSLEFVDGTSIDITNIRNTPLGTTASETITGTSGNDTMFGGGGNDTLNGGDGNDSLIAGRGGTTTLSGGAGNDTLFGGSSLLATFHSGTGNDILFASSGDNVFVMSLGDGRDTIQLPSYLTAMPTSTVQFAGGYDTMNPTLGLGSLVIRYGTMGDELHIVDFDPNDVFASPAVQRFEFTDRVLTYEELLARGFDITGTSGHDVLTGTNTTDRLVGYAGDDQLNSGAGADTLTGGQGNDTLRGGAGDDAYVFNLGDGIDTIEDAATATEGNRIQFGAGIVQTDLTFVRDETARTLTIQVGSSGTDQLHLMDFDPTGADGSLVVSTLQFADGSTLNLADLFPQNRPPTVATPLADQTVPEDAPLSIQVPANAFADEDAGDVLTYSASLAEGSALPVWLSFDAATRTFTGTPDDAQVGSLDLTVTATDTGNLTASDVFTLTVQNVNEAPTVANPLAAQQATEDAPFSLVLPANTFADQDLGDTLTYSATLAGGAALPAWLNFDPATRTFSGTPLNSDVGNLNIAVNATDSGGLSATNTFALTIQNVNDAPTVAAPIADQVAAEDSAFTLTVPDATFTDEDLLHGDALTYGATLADGSPLPGWLNFNPNSLTFSGTPDAGDAGNFQIAVTATDTQNLSVTDLFTLAISGPLPQTVIGTTGDDGLTGGRGDDTLIGLAGHDVLDGGEGSDTMIGSAGNDLYVVDASGDGVTELANDGFDTVLSAVTYTLSANVDALVLTGSNAINGTGNSLNNGLTGNNAANVLDGGTGTDVMAGFEGNDVYLVDHTGDVVIELANQGDDTVRSRVTYALAANVEHLTLTGSAAINGTGNSLNNMLTGNSAANILAGGAGNDTYVVGTGDTVVESSNGGVDSVQSAVSWTLGSNLEHLTLVGVAAMNGTGNGLNNVLTGNSATNLLSGAGGNDTLRSGLGNDTVTGGTGNDTFLFGRGDGQDLVQDSSGAADKLLYDAGIDPLDLVISRQANDLRLAIHGSTDYVTVQNWYSSSSNRTETIQVGNGQTLLSIQVDQLIQAMAGFTAQTGLTWDQGIDQQPQDVQAILAASWQ